MITLCSNSFEIAQKKPNFSAWVRKMLLEEHDEVDERTFFYHYQCPLCKELTHYHQRHSRKCVKAGCCQFELIFQGKVE